MPISTAVAHQHKVSGAAHVHRVAAEGGVADDGTDAERSHRRPDVLGRGTARKPAGMPELDRHVQFAGPNREVIQQRFAVGRGEVGRELDEGGTSFGSEGEQAGDEVVGGSFAAAESAEVADDLGEFGTKPEVVGHGSRPFRHPSSGVDAVVCSVELYGIERFTIVCGPNPLRDPRRVHAAAPRIDGPHGSTCSHGARARLTADAHPVRRQVPPPLRQAFERVRFAELHSGYKPTPSVCKAAVGAPVPGPSFVP